MSEQYVNLASTTAASAINNSSNPVTFSLTSGAGSSFPATTNGGFRVTVSNSDGTNAEVMLCTSRSTDALTCSRGSSCTFESPAPSLLTHAVGSIVSHNLTVGAHDQTRADQIRTTFSGSLPTDGRQGDILIPSDDVVVSVNNGSNFLPGWSNYPLRGSPTAQTWSWYNQTSASVTTRSQSIVLKGTANSGSSIQGRTFAVPSTPYCALFTLIPYIPYANYPFVGPGFTDGTKVSLVYLIGINPATNTIGFYTQGAYYSTATASASGLSLSEAFMVGPSLPVTFALQDDGTHRKYGISFDNGLYIAQTYSETSNTNVTPTALGFFINSNDSNAVVSTVLTNLYIASSTLF